MKPNRNNQLTGILLGALKNAVTTNISGSGEYICKSILTRFCPTGENGCYIKNKDILGDSILIPQYQTEYWETEIGMVVKVEGDCCITAIGND